MDYGSQILHMIFLIIFFLISFHCTHILIVNNASFNAIECYNRHGQNEVYYRKSSGHRRENHIGKVPGEKEQEDQKALRRDLLGLKTSLTGKSRNDFSIYGTLSPSPSPSTNEAPAPSPVLPVHMHSHRPSHHHHVVPQSHKMQKNEKKKARRVITAVLVSAGVGSVLCAFGFFWGRKKFRNKRKKTTKTLSIYCSEAGSRSSSEHSQNSVKKVRSDPGPDLFYLESLEAALEPQPYCLKQNSVTLNPYSNQNVPFCTLNERGELEQLIKAEADNHGDSCSAVGEIIPADKNVELNKITTNGCNSSSVDNIIPEEAHSSDDKSFHYLCNSQSSDVRLSDASAGSINGLSETRSANASKESDCSMTSSSHLPTLSPKLNPSSSSASNSEANQILSQPMRFPPPPPPPPPPRVSHLHITPTHSSSSSARKTSNNLSSSRLSNVSSPGNSKSSSGSNQNPQCALLPSPLNPPKPPQGIPSPICPPPFSKGNANSLKNPPPLPSHISQFTPVGKDSTRLPKLKPLHWDKVRAAPDRSTVWDKLRSSSFEFDEEMIESLFGYNLQNTMKNEEVKTKTASPSKHVLQPKRLQNITILSKALNVTAEQVCQALIQGNGLTLQELEALAKMVPTKEEEAKLSNYRGDVNELGYAEKFVKAVLEIPFAFLRIEAMLYRETFGNEVIHLRKSFAVLEEACNELRSSRLFLKLLEAVLKTGNRMNVGTIRGGAKAFKLDALLKLADVKGTDGKTSLLHFVVQEIVRSEGFRVSDSIMGKINHTSKGKSNQDKEEEYKRMGLDLVSGLSTELSNVKKTATINLDVLASSVSNLSDGMTKLQRLVMEDLCMEEENGNFVHTMSSFLSYAENNLKELQEEENRVLFHVREITEYFHGDVSKEESNPLRIFVIVTEFLGMLDHVCKELRSLKVSSSPNPLAPF